MSMWTAQPDHRGWLADHRRHLLAFGRDQAPDTVGARWLDAGGGPDATRPVHTWITARTVHVQGLGVLLGVPGCRPLADRALAALRGALHDDAHGGWYTAVAPDGAVVDATKSAYAHAFVVLAAATATVAELDGGRALLEEALGVLDARFFEAAAGLHADEWDAAFTTLSPYRGLNANMHAVEALLAAADATGQPRWAERAAGITARVVAWARDTDWRVPEHFDAGWRPRLDLNRDRPDDPFKPYGATVGHGLEWSRLCLHVRAAGAVTDTPDLLAAARALYDRAVTDGWAVDGAEGFVYTTDWDGAPVVRTRMHWVVAEAIGAAAALHRATGERRYAADYRRWWDYAATHLVDADQGSWHHELDPGNRPAATVWPGKPDLYHAVQATLVPLLPLAPMMALAVREQRWER